MIDYIFAVRQVKKSDMDKLSRATGERIVTNLKDLSPEDPGSAKKVEEMKIAGDEMVFVCECKEPKAVSILVRGGTEHVVEEIERAITDALGGVATAIEVGKVVTGGGATESILAMTI